MSNRKAKPAAPENQPGTATLTRKQVPCFIGDTDEATALNYAKLIISPEMASFRVITNREREDLLAQLDTPSLIGALREQTQAVHRGDMKAAEAMLMNQATALQSLFVKLTETGLQAGLLRQQETALRLALKAQSQCRATLETLAAIKNPPVIFAKQANIAHGPQQVNNDSFETNTRTRAHARKAETTPDELLKGQQHGSTDMDNRAATTPARGHPTVEALEPIHRPRKPRRKSGGGA